LASVNIGPVADLGEGPPKKNITEGKKAGRASKTPPSPLPKPKAWIHHCGLYR